MKLNPCCIPLKTGVRMVTHLSMALALAVGWTSLKLISISSEVSSIVPSSTSRPTDVLDKFPPQNEWYKEQQQPSYYNPPRTTTTVENQIFQQPPDPYHHFRIPYEYILYYNWHQQQLQQQSHNLDHQQQSRQDDTLSSWPWHHRQGHIQPGPSSISTRSDGRGLGSPISPLSSPPKQVEPPQTVESKSEADEDEHIFRSILRHRKNFKGEPSLPRESTTPGLFLDSETEREDKEAALAQMPTPSSLRVHGKERESDEEGEQLPIDWFPFFPPQNEKGVDGSSTASIFPGRAEAVTSQLSPQPRQQDAEEMNRRMMMSKLTSNSQRDDTAGYGGIRTASKKRLTDFKEQYAKVLLVCGLLALCTVVFQFLTSFLLLCFVDKGSNAAAQIWTAVNCSVIFSLAVCLVLFLCEGLSMAKYSFDETLYLCLVTVDSLLSIYFLWVVMAFI